MINAKEASELYYKYFNKPEFSKEMLEFIKSNYRGFELLEELIIEANKINSSNLTYNIKLNLEYQDFLARLDYARFPPSNLKEFIFEMYYYKQFELFEKYLVSLGYKVSIFSYRELKLFMKEVEIIYLKISWREQE